MERNNTRKTNKNKNIKHKNQTTLLINITKNTRIAGKIVFFIDWKQNKKENKNKTQNKTKKHQKQSQHNKKTERLKHTQWKQNKNNRRKTKKKTTKNESKLDFKKGMLGKIVSDKQANFRKGKGKQKRKKKLTKSLL